MTVKNLKLEINQKINLKFKDPKVQNTINNKISKFSKLKQNKIKI